MTPRKAKPEPSKDLDVVADEPIKVKSTRVRPSAGKKLAVREESAVSVKVAGGRLGGTPGVTHQIQTTQQPWKTITVDDTEYLQLLAEGLVYSGSPVTPPADFYDQTIADKVTGGTATPAALKAALVPFWAPAETVTAGTVRMDSTGHTITRIASGTTRATYDATEQAAWTVVSGGGGSGSGLPSNVLSKTAAFTAAAGDFVQGDTTTAGFTVTLPSAPATGALVAVKKVDSSANTLTIVPAGTGNIDGDPNATTTTKMAGAIFEHVGSDVWRIVASMTTTGPTGATGPAGPQGATGATGAAGPGVPVGGTSGQVLTKNSSTDYDTHWAAASGGGSAMALWYAPAQSGEWLTSPVLGGNTSVVANLNDLVFAPFYLASPMTVTALGFVINAAGAAGAVVRPGIYASDAGNRPAALIVDAGAVAATTTGVQTVTLGSSVALAAGMYWTVLVPQVSNASLSLRGYNTGFGAPGRSAVPSSNGLALQTPGDGLFHQTAVSGALPATATPVAAYAGLACAIVGLKAA